MKRLIAALVAFSTVALVAAVADACGFWYLNDGRGHRIAEFLINGVLTARKKSVAIYSEQASPLRCSVGDRHLTIGGEHVISGGRIIARIDGQRWTVGKHIYDVQLALHPEEEIHRWYVTVREGGRLIADGKAMPFSCSVPFARGGRVDDRRDVERRLLCYLIARDAAVERAR